MPNPPKAQAPSRGGFKASQSNVIYDKFKRFIKRNLNNFKFDLRVERYTDPCNTAYEVTLQVGTSSYPRYIQFSHNPYCTPNPKPPHRKKISQENNIYPITIPNVEEGLWININWTKEFYYDAQPREAEGWKYDQYQVEILNINYPVFFDVGYGGCEITLKVKYQSRKSDFWDNSLTSGGSGAVQQELHSINDEWIHTYKVWSRYAETEELSYISHRITGEYWLFAQGLSDPIALIYLELPRTEILNRWGENATAFYRNPQPSYFQRYTGDLTDINRSPELITVNTPIRSYSIIPFEFGEDFYGNYAVRIYDYLIFRTASWEVLGYPNQIKAPPPPRRKKCKCMCCCDDSLLKALLAKINKIYKAVGVDDYPVNAPQWLTVKNSPSIQIDNLTRFVSYSVKQLDAVAGKYPIDIEIQDTDLTESGNQTKTIKLPNIAESLAEIMGLLMILRAESDANLSASVRAMIETGSIKQAATLAYEYSKANAEFLGYKGKQVNRSLGMTFTPGKQKLDELLHESNVNYRGWENDDKDDFNDHLAPLLELAAMWKAQNYRHVANGSVSILKDLLTKPSQIPKDMDNPTGETNQQDHWSEFLEKVEQGFIGESGVFDNTHPYGKDYARRPRVRKIGDDTVPD